MRNSADILALLRQVLLLGMLLLTMPLFAEEQAAPAALPIHKECIDEPVFGQRACIYEANREAAQTVVLVHGLNGQALRDWAQQIQPLARHYHVLSFDLPGFGESDKGPGYYAPSSYARFIRFVTERYARRPFHLVGHSMGGAIALRYSADNPDDVERLVLVDVAGVLHRMAYARMLAAAWAENQTVYGHSISGFFNKMTYKLMTKVEGLTGLGNEYLARKLLEHELLDADPQVIAAFTLANEDLSDALTRIRGPVLMVWGEEDKVAPLRTAMVLKARLPQTKLVTLPGAAHSPMNEASDAFNRELLDFLQGTEGVGMEAHVEETVPESGLEMPPQLPRQIECRNQSDKVYEGSFERIVLHGCEGIVIRNATIGSLQAKESRAVIENSRIGMEEGTGLTSVGSELTITATTLSGRVAIHASRSRLDLAGVTLIGVEKAVSGDSGSSLIFSVSELRTPERSGSIHGYFEVDRNNPL